MSGNTTVPGISTTASRPQPMTGRQVPHSADPCRRRPTARAPARRCYKCDSTPTVGAGAVRGVSTEAWKGRPGMNKPKALTARENQRGEAHGTTIQQP